MIIYVVVSVLVSGQVSTKVVAPYQTVMKHHWVALGVPGVTDKLVWHSAKDGLNGAVEADTNDADADSDSGKKASEKKPLISGAFRSARNADPPIVRLVDSCVGKAATGEGEHAEAETAKKAWKKLRSWSCIIS